MLILNDLFDHGGAENIIGSISLIIDDLGHISNLLMDILEEKDDNKDYESLDKLNEKWLVKTWNDIENIVNMEEGNRK